MPFDGTAASSAKVRLLALGADLLSFAPSCPSGEATAPRAIPAWHRCRPRESMGDTLAVLARARELLSDERRWCRGSFARGWRGIPVPVGSTVARRYCALGALMRASRELSLSAEDACVTLEWQIGRPIPDWNDDPLRTYADVISVFEAAITALKYPG